MLPAESKVPADGSRREAAVAGPPIPVASALPLPATVVIIPLGVTLRIRRLDESAIYKLPRRSNAIPTGYCSDALVAGPPSPENAGLPLPAKVEILPSPVTFRMR